MDFATIASTAVAAVVPYLAKSGESIAEEVGQDLWGRIKKTFTSERDQSLATQLEDHPADAKVQGKVELKLEELLAVNPELATEMEGLLARVNRSDRSYNATATITGDNNTTLQGIDRSQININQR